MQETAESSVSPTAKLSILKHLLENKPETLQSTPAKIIVLKNNYLGMVREFQHYTYKDNYSVVDTATTCLLISPRLTPIAAGIE